MATLPGQGAGVVEDKTTKLSPERTIYSGEQREEGKTDVQYSRCGHKFSGPNTVYAGIGQAVWYPG